MDYKIQLQSISRSTQITSTNNDSIGFLLKRLIHNSPKTHFLHIAKNDREATILQKQIEFFASHNVSEGELEILNFPSWDCLPYDRVSPKINVVASRINCLHKLIKNAPPSSANKKTLVISTIKAALQKTVPAELIKNLGFKIEVGDEVSIDLLARSLIDNGFSRTGIASGISEFAIRGNIVDIITASNQIADDLIGYRLDFFGDTIEAIRVFDPATQLTLNKVNQVSLLPMAEINLNEKAINNFKKNYRTIFGSPSEDMLYNSASEGRHCDGIEHFMPLFYEQPLSSIFEYLENPQISFSSSLAEAKNEHLKTINEYYMARVDGLRESKKSGAIYNPIEPSSLYLNDAKFEKELEKNVVIIFSESKPSQKDRQIDLNFKPIPDFALASRANKTNVFDLFKNFLEAELGNNTLDKSRETAIPLNRGFHKIVLFCSSEGSKERLRKILVEHQINNKSITKAQEISKLSKNQIGLGILPIGNGFYCSDLMVIGESALLGEKVRRSNSRQSFEKMIAEGLTLQVGELIVHRYHGIGKFDGLHNIETGTSSTSNSSRSDDFLLKKLNTKPKTIKNDFLKILYFGSDVLFVPVEDINLISRYGSDNSLIILDKLGKNNWENRREKVRKKIKIAAETLIKIAAERQIRKAPILIPGQMEYEEFKATFGFEETEDQIRAISEVEEDLQKGSPMDRLVCGDVGFGKTEVAIRAAFIVAANEYVNKEIINISNPTQPKEIEIENKGSNLKKEESSNTQNSIHSEETGDPRNAGRNECSVLQEKECVSTRDPRNAGRNECSVLQEKECVSTRDPRNAGRNECFVLKNKECVSTKYQTAIITPTTLLCRQHYKNFVARFSGTNIKIAQLSRMVTVAEAKKIKQDLENGKIDIVIGTHALLNKNIKFKKLGLMIVDEEQHFGVIQKERLKEFRSEVHILTLSATPIPRTMQMSLSGVKELSIIATPPADRMAVRNYVMPYDSVIIREAILREYQRGGRVFFVVPRISDLNQLFDNLSKQIPEVKIEIAHGQMPANDLDAKMNDFYDGKFDVLLSTTIVESGIDISFANTMIIYKSEHFGLAQLYQLRGRVGRGKTRGYCYFTTKVHNLSEIARKKLEVIKRLETLGSGFSVASHDMDIRGSGNILGDEQSGHIRETGAELYQSMLLDEIKKLKKRNSQALDPKNKNSSNSTDVAEIELAEEDFQIQIKLGISLLITEEYIDDLQIRMQLYKRIAGIKNKEDQEQISSEIIDRFGKMPIEIENLLEMAYLKNLCREVNIEKLEIVSQGILISFKNNHFADGDKLLEMVFSSKNQIKLQGHKVLFLMKNKSDDEKLSNALNVLNRISNLIIIA